MIKFGGFPGLGGRLAALALGAVLWALIIFCRLVQLQVVSCHTYRLMAERQQQRTIELTAARGTIFDRNGKPLAISVPVDSVCLNPLRVPDRPMAANLLARVLSGVDAADLLKKMDKAVNDYRRLGRKARGFGFLWVKRKITPGESEAIRSLKLDWIEFRQESQRSYPDGSLASHVLGSVDFKERGNDGLELKLDGELRGRSGTARVVADVARRGIESMMRNDAEPGKNITLAIDERIQFVAERELKAACELYGAPTGSVVVMDPETGELLAMASYPTFDPNEPPEKGADPSVRFNEPVSVAFEPGSVFKIVTYSAAMETAGIRPDTPVNCNRGVIRLAGRTVHDSHGGLGVLPAAEAFAKSSNVAAIQVALRVGKENLYKYVRTFGFGEATGIPLPAESRGYIRKPEVWHPAAIASVAMGHEVSVTTLQLAQAASVIANGGVLVRPRLILSRQRPGGPVEKEPAVEPKRILKPETAITMRRMMEGVVLNGTGKAARLSGYTCGGKTGSAQIFDRASRQYTHLYNGSFVGFAPVTNPRIVIAVTLNGVKLFGGVVAAPVFKAVATETLRILQVPKDLPEEVLPELSNPEEANDLASAEGSEPPEDLGDAPAVPQVAVLAPPDTAAPDRPAPVLVSAAPEQVVPVGPRVPEFQGKTMRSVLEESLAAGVPVEIVGSGVARAQTPPAGAFLNPGQRVRVEFR